MNSVIKSALSKEHGRWELTKMLRLVWVSTKLTGWTAISSAKSEVLDFDSALDLDMTTLELKTIA